ncbi:MAG: fatty acid CoA ligase family protein [Armatimonadaceae bacterium]
MNTAELFLRQARERPDAVALIETDAAGMDHFLTFRELDHLSARGAALLQNSGLQPGTTALVFQPMSIDLYVALVSLFRAGIVAMFLDPSAGLKHIQRCCELRPPNAFLGSPRAHLLRLVSPAIRRIPCQIVFGDRPVPGAISWAAAQARIAPESAVEPCDPDTPALLTFTSGSTGQPKAAVRTHGLLRAQHRALAESIHLRPGQIDLTTLPIFALANLASGVTTLIPAGDLRRPGSVKTPPIIAQIRRHKPDRAGASPAFFERLFAAGEFFPEFRQLYTGGAPVFPVVMDRMQNAAPRARVVAVYGSTEAEPIADVAREDISPSDQKAMLGGGGLLAGVPVEAVDLQILRECWGKPVGPFTGDAFLQALCGVGEPGEIVVAGDHVLPGYLNGNGDAETKFRVDGRVWHRTGDSGYRDASGRLWLLGRCSATITDSHGTLHPFAVEVAARQTPGVRRAALVDHRGKRVLLIEAERNQPPQVAELQRTLAWANLDGIRLWREIPMDRRHNAKVDYAALRRCL